MSLFEKMRCEMVDMKYAGARNLAATHEWQVDEQGLRGIATEIVRTMPSAYLTEFSTPSLAVQYVEQEIRAGGAKMFGIDIVVK